MYVITVLKEPILEGCYIKKCPFLNNITIYHTLYKQPVRSNPIGLASCYINEKRPDGFLVWCASLNQCNEYHKWLNKKPENGSFIKILQSREYCWKFPYHTTITTFFNDGKGTAETKNNFF